jgi:hypothetical protein
LVVVYKVHKKRSGKQGMSPVISTVIMTGAIVAILSVALVFANNLLWSRVAEGEFDSSKQFMQSVGLQIDDVAWTVGRTETIRYSSQYGEVVLEPDVLTYTISVETTGGENYEFSNETAALMFNLPTSRYSISDDYRAAIFPDPDDSLTLTGTSAPVARVFAVEQVPMADGSYIRVVVVPAVRVLYSSITTGATIHYIRMYLPVLSAGEAPRLSQSITLTGESLNAHTINDVDSISVAVSFQEGSDFDSAFFNFPFDLEKPVSVPSGDVVLEFYLSEVEVEFGLNY